MNVVFSILFLISIILSNIQFLLGEPIIQLPNGKILGRESTTSKNKTFYAFEGIPYAAPPVGDLRFKPPQPPQNWSDILNTTYLEVTCFQTSGNSDAETEDCLYINVFTPQLLEDNNMASVPVMIFIYGGGFDDGTCQSYNAPDLFINEGVILVTFNYRVGIFGFLSTQDAVIPGNIGLKDQQFAIEWTRNNIRYFGGDSNQITIFGQSAGSASVAYHLLNDKSTGLFQGAILQSGSCLSPWAYQRQTRKIAFATAAFLNSTFATCDDSQVLLEFLQNTNAEDLDYAAFLYKTSASSPDNLEISQGFYWAPVIEVENPDAFITEKMYKILETGNFVKVPIIIGITSEESLLFNPIPILFQLAMSAYDDNPDWLVPDDMQIFNHSQKIEMGLLIQEMYGMENVENLGAGIRFSSDTSFTRSIIKHAELYSKFSETYFYKFSYHGAMGRINIHYDNAENVSHGEDVSYIFCSGLDCDGTDYAESDKNTRERLIKLWTNFARFRNPTPEQLEVLQNITWPAVNITESDFLYLNIGENLTIMDHPKEETYHNWIQLYDTLEHSDFDTF